MFVWVFHRVSGLLLIVLIGVQLFTGFVQATPSAPATIQSAAALHRHVGLVCLLVFLFIFHSFYGIRTILLDLGMRRERPLFWACTVAGLLLYVAFLVGYWRHVTA